MNLLTSTLSQREMHCLQLLQTTSFFLPAFPPIHSKTSLKPHLKYLPQSPRKPFHFIIRSLSSDEFPVDDDDEAFLRNLGPKDKETEDEARKRNWIERGWAPWEEILSPEANFARKSLNEGEEVELKDPESIEAFKMLSPKYREEKRKQLGLTEDEWHAKQFEIKGEIPEPLKTVWAGPLVLRHIPPRDWPPEGWEVDRGELEFIREAHKIHHVTQFDYENVDENASREVGDMCMDRFKMFLKQYKEWVAANKDRLEEESFKYDQDDYPGRRKRGKDYVEGMYELPFYYPGQICAGKVTAVHLYQGAFVDIGGVHEGWVPIKRNDWFWIRHHIKVNMLVTVEILAKRDPFLFRFPIEMRFLDPNIDHLIFNRFDFAPIFHRSEDINPDELRRECGRPPVPRKDPGIKWEEEPLLSNHPYVNKLWQIHNAEQMVLDDVDANPDKYKDKNLAELSDDEDFDEENSVQQTETYYKKKLYPLTIVKVSVKELNLEAAFAERQHHNRMRKEAEDRGEKYKITKLRRNIEMDEYDLIHWQRSFEEREALLRDISCRQALGLPLEEPGRYKDVSFFGKDQYDPDNPLYRYDYWGEPKNSEKSKQERVTQAHNKSIVGKGDVWYDMSYEDAMKQKMEREAQGRELKQYDDEEEEETNLDDDEDDSDEEDFDYSIFGEPDAEVYVPHVNGTTSSRLSDEGMFDEN